MGNLWAVILSVIIPLLVFMLALRPWIKDTVRAELSDFKVDIGGRLSRIEGRLEQIGLDTRKIADFMPPSNPNGRREEFLAKWRQGTLTYQESIELRDILAHEAERAEESRKALLTLGLIGLLLYGLSRKD